ncbi:MAG TPA: HPr kinase/phosphorylase, partial [Ignavibacteriales bacterium]|nr:HPr kinase/phosphorylase [Ignavibacteriales bacterium]
MLNIENYKITRRDCITVDFFYHRVKDKFKLELYTDNSGFERQITEQNLHRPGLALAGFVDLFSYSRIQIFGNTEMQYLEKVDKNERITSLTRIFQFNIPCI